MKADSRHRGRLIIVSPFIDNRHGTERHLVECIPRLAEAYEIHLYSQRVEDMEDSTFVLHRIPRIPGPHLVNYIWWFVANHVWRWLDHTVRGLTPDVVYSPGINCLDAGAVTVHVIFAELRKRLENELRFVRNPVRSWTRILHRRLYYRLIAMLERRVYFNPRLQIGVVSQRVAGELARIFGRSSGVEVIYLGVDPKIFNAQSRVARRDAVRQRFSLKNGTFTLLLIGNGWHNKGLGCLLEALGRLKDLPLQLLVVGSDDPSFFETLAVRFAVRERVTFLPESSDVMQFYSACDAYVGPSLHDSFAQPPAEAMACGLPVITSRNNGGSEIIRHGESGLILENAKDPDELAALIRRIYGDAELRKRLGESAARAAAELTWERHVDRLRVLLDRAWGRRGIERDVK